MDVSGVSASVQNLLPQIRQRCGEIEVARRLPRDLAESLRQTEMFSLSVPRAIGGKEATPLELMRTIETVAVADGFTGWCSMVGIANNIAAGYMTEQGAKEVFGNPAAPTAGIAAPAGQAVRVDGGVRVRGRWPFASGVTHSDWIWAGCLVMEGDHPHMTPMGPEIIHACMPVRDVTIHDTWHVSGLRGTGSEDVSVEDILVPDRRTFLLLDPRGHRAEPLYQMPPLHLFVFQLATVALGIARRALDDLAELAQTKVPTMYMQVLADKAVAHVDIARAEAVLGGARAFLYETVEGMWETVRGGGTPTTRQLALGRAASTHAVDTAAAVTRTVNTLAGGSAIYASSSFQRYARDAEAMTHHFTVSPHSWEESGRVLLGRQPITPVF